jgi:isocitrate lyase
MESSNKLKRGLTARHIRFMALGLAYAPYADLVWCETSTPDLALAKRFADAIHAKYPGKLLAYNCGLPVRCGSLHRKRHRMA